LTSERKLYILRVLRNLQYAFIVIFIELIISYKINLEISYVHIKVKFQIIFMSIRDKCDLDLIRFIRYLHFN